MALFVGRAVDFWKHTRRAEVRDRPLPRLALLERTVVFMEKDISQVHHVPALHGQPRPRGPHHGTACELQGMPTCPPGKVRRGRRMLHGRRNHSVDDGARPWTSKCAHLVAKRAHTRLLGSLFEKGLGAPPGESDTDTHPLALQEQHLRHGAPRGVASALRGTDQSPSDGRVR